MSEATKQLVCQFIEQSVPFNKWLGIHITRFEPGVVEASIPFKDELIGNPFRPALHGGILSAFIDAIGGAAAFSQLSMNDRISTVDLRVDYLRPGRPLGVRCRARVVRLGNRVAAVAAEVWQDDAPDHPIAMGMAVYNVRRGREDATDALPRRADGTSAMEED